MKNKRSKSNRPKLQDKELPSNKSKLLKNEYETLIHDPRFDINHQIIQPALAHYIKDDRIEFRTSTEFKSILRIVGIIERKSIGQLITEGIFKNTIKSIAKSYPNLFGDSKNINGHSLAEIVMEISKHVAPEFVTASNIFTNVSRKIKNVHVVRKNPIKKQTAKRTGKK